MPANLGFPLPFDAIDPSNVAITGGSIRGVSGVPLVLSQSAVAASVTGTLTETVLATIPIPAGAMGVNGALRVTALWSFPNNANNKSIIARLGGLIIGSGVRTTSVSDYWLLPIWNTGVFNSQIRPPAPIPVLVSSGLPQTSAIDMSASQTLTLSATLGNIADTITLNSYTVELLNP